MILRNKQIRWFKATDYVKTNGNKAYDIILEFVDNYEEPTEPMPYFQTMTSSFTRTAREWDYWDPKISEMFAQGRTMARPIAEYLNRIPKVFK